jgi:peroxiredoxin
MKIAGFLAIAAALFGLSLMLGANEKEEPSSLEGKAAPDFTMKSTDDKDVKLADLKGSVVLLDFWATWCPPCRESLPHLQKIHDDKALADKGLKVYAVNLREDKDKAKGYVDENKLTFPVLLDKEGATAKAYLVSGIPTTIVIGRDGKIAKAFVGFGDESEKEIRSAVNDALKAK